MNKKLLFSALMLLMVKPVWAATPPQYLAIADFELCLHEKNMGTYTVWCMPSKKVASCPKASWKALKKLKNKDKVEKC